MTCVGQAYIDIVAKGDAKWEESDIAKSFQ